jgi:alkylation response protein AidB-like acyl-CoA dehydrogenase
MAVETARLMVYKACWLKDQGKPYQLESAMAKCLAADVAMKVTTDAVQVMGGYGYMKEYPTEKMMRDAKIMQIYEGTNQIQRLVIANNILY